MYGLGLIRKLISMGHCHHRVGAIALTFLFTGCTLSSNASVAQSMRDAETLRNEAGKEVGVGNYSTAVKTLQQALLSAKRAKNPTEESNTMGMLGLVYSMAGQHTKALEVRKERLSFVRANRQHILSSSDSERTVLDKLSNSYAALGNYREAEAILSEIVSLQIRESREYVRDKNRAYAEIYGNTEIYAKGAPRSLMRLGIVQLLGGELARAEESLVAAQSAFEKQTRNAKALGGNNDFSRNVIESQVEVLRWLTKLRVLQGRTDEALLLAERGRSRALASLMQRSLPDSPAGSDDTAVSLEEVKKVASSRQVTIVVYAIVYAHHPELYLEFADTASQPVSDLLIWVVQPNGKIAHKRVIMDPPVRFSDLIGEDRLAFLRGLSVVPVRGSSAAGQAKGLERLAQLLVDPIEGALPTTPDSHVVFIPQDALFRVSFAALPMQDGKYLIEKYAVSTAPSIAVMRLSEEMQAQLVEGTGQALIVGNPEMPILAGQQLPDLPAAGREAETIAALLRTKAFVGKVATESAVVSRASSARLIHLATHGLVDNSESDLSSIALAPTEGVDGFLQARELARLRLQAELVVLSACDTARGKISGDGVAGLSRALIGAGASSLVVSLWSIPDAPTEYLMHRFYQHMKDKGDKAQALRAAMLETLKEHPTPVNWAAFVLIGSSAVSRSLMAGLQTGMAEARSDTFNQQEAVEHIPVPEGATDYTEHRSPPFANFSYKTTMSHKDLARFYRKVLGDRGLHETASSGFYFKNELEDSESRQLKFSDRTDDLDLTVHISTPSKGPINSVIIQAHSKKLAQRHWDEVIRSSKGGQ